MKILVIGSAGFIGSHLVRFYLNKGVPVFGADIIEAGSLLKNYFKISRLSPEYDELLQLTKFDACINCAGSSSVPYSMSHPVLDFEANCLDTIRILDGIKKYQPGCKYLHISSAAVYGNPTLLPIVEGSDLMPISPYGWHKLIAEKICKEYSINFGVSVAIARPFSVYGPGLKRQFFWDLFTKISAAPGNSKVTLFGTGDESRDFIYIEDLVRAFDQIIQTSDFKADEYNVASGRETSIREAAVIFNELYGKMVSIDFNNQERSGDPKNWRADTSKLSFVPQHDLKSGLLKTIEWLKGLELKTNE